MTSIFIVILVLVTRSTCVNTQKINRLVLKTYNITLVKFLFQDSLEIVLFFEKIF